MKNGRSLRRTWHIVALSQMYGTTKYRWNRLLTIGVVVLQFVVVAFIGFDWYTAINIVAGVWIGAPYAFGTYLRWKGFWQTDGWWDYV